MEKVKAFADWLTKWFTVIVIVWAVFNYFVPAASLWGKAYTGYMLGIVLFGMGLTLTLLVEVLSLVGLVQTLRGLKSPLPGIWRITRAFHPFN